jgi:hypothetical protein
MTGSCPRGQPFRAGYLPLPAGSARDPPKQLEPPLRFRLVALGEFEVHVAELIAGVVDLRDPALAGGGRKLHLRSEGKQRRLHLAVVADREA